MGSVGIVVRAYRLGHIWLVDAERYLNALYDTSSLFVTRVIVDLAIEQLRASFTPSWGEVEAYAVQEGADWLVSTIITRYF